MSKQKTHWRPRTGISYPSGPGRMRTFVLPDNVVCHNDGGDWSQELKWVTCKRCLRIAAMHRADTPETIAKVLRRNDPA